MTKIEVDGLKLDFDEDAILDIDVADWLYDLSSGTQIPPIKKLINACFGASQYQRIVDKLRGEDGHVSIVAAAEFFAEAVTKAGQKKS